MISLGFFNSIFVRTTVNYATLTELGSGEIWLAYGRNHSQQRPSPLTQINDKNVEQVGIDWCLDLSSDRSLTGRPLVVDGIL
jgi:quinohemoprotein ethanol dehydrogenase